MNIFYKSINVTIQSCISDEDNNYDSTNFTIQLTPFDNTLMDMNDQHFLPAYIDNKKWSYIEFICQLKLDFLIISNDEFYFKDFKFVRYLLSCYFNLYIEI